MLNKTIGYDTNPYRQIINGESTRSVPLSCNASFVGVDVSAFSYRPCRIIRHRRLFFIASLYF
jgi:hypothetical protein